eukprot:9248418-Prorocentrum_lima.AAC.1
MSSIAWVADITCPFNFGAPVLLLQEHSLEAEHHDPEHEAFLVQVEAELNPNNWLKGSSSLNCNPYDTGKTVQYENIWLFMQACFYNNEERIFDYVFEICGGTAKVPVIMFEDDTQELWRYIRE